MRVKKPKKLRIKVAYKHAQQVAEILKRAGCAFDGWCNSKHTVYNVYIP